MNLLNRFNGPVRFAIGILLIGVMFKIMHWAGGNLIMSLAFGLIIIFYALKVVKMKEKTTLDVVKLILIGFWCVQGILSINHLPYSNLFKYGFWISLAVWGLIELFIDSNETEEQKGK